MTALANRIEGHRTDPQIDPDALPCPFCGAPATIEYWHGGKPTRRMIKCSGQSDTLMRRGPITCHVGPSVMGETRTEALRRWNGRR